MITNKTINICIPMDVDECVKKFIFKNINYSRKVWNNFVEEAKKFEGDRFLYDGFKPLKFKTEYFKIEEENNIYDEYCVGISAQISNNMKHALNIIRNKNFDIMRHNKTYHDNKKLWKLRFHSFDKYYGSFKVENKATITKSKYKSISNRIHIKDAYTLTFRVRGGQGSKYQKEHITIHLKEPLFKYRGIGEYYPSFIREYKVKGENAVECEFNELDIRTTSFIHKLGKFYIQLSINVTYKIKDSDIKSRQLKAGIDTGIHNPAVLYNGENYYRIGMPEKTVRKLHYLERRARRIQHIMDKKYMINKERVKHGELESPYTNNYEKVRYKFRKVWNKIINIKRNWIYTKCKFIVTHFQKICVDRFVMVDNSHIKSHTIRRRYNFNNRFHCMYTFNEILSHMAIKYGCNYIESPENTTRTCSICGHKNPHLPLSERYLVCEECSTIIDRDENAAQNCYMYI